MEFHLIVNGKQEGPFSVEELSQKGITPESEVWAPGMDDWKQAGDVAELTAVLQRAEFEASQAAARAAENQATMGQPYEPSYTPNQVPPSVPPRTPVQEQPKKKSGCTPWLIAALIVAILFVTMVFTCPSRHDHEMAIQEVTKEWLGEKIQDNVATITGNNGLGGMMSDIIGRVIEQLTGTGTDKIISTYLHVDNYMVCSVGCVRLVDKEKVVSVGLLGHVFTFGKENLEQLWAQVMDQQEDKRPSILPTPAPQQTQPSYGDEEEEQDMVDPQILPDSILGVEVPEGMDSMLNSLANDVVRAAKEWAKNQIDNLGKK